jgi:hypothetical protein
VAPPADVRLIQRHVAAFNRGVRTRDWEPMLRGFAPDAETAFPGTTFRGVDEIRAAYEADGPEEEIVLLGVDGRTADFAWRSGGTGRMMFELAAGSIRRLTVVFDQ